MKTENKTEQETTSDGVRELAKQRIAEIAVRITALDCERTTLNRERYELGRLVKTKVTAAQ